MDKNTIIGLGLIAAILGLGLYFTGPSDEQIARNKQIRDSLAKVEKKEREQMAAKIAAEKKAEDTIRPQSAISDSVVFAQKQSEYRDFLPALEGKPETYVLENKHLKVHFTNKGGFIHKVELKGYHRPGQTSSLVLFDKDSTRYALQLRAYDDVKQYFTDEFYFKNVKQTERSIELRLETAKPGSHIDFVYTLEPEDYMVKSEIRFSNMQSILFQNDDQMVLHWSMLYPSQEKYIIKEKETATIYYKLADNNDVNNLSPAGDEEESLAEAPAKWISFKQQYFNATVIADEKFGNADSKIKIAARPESQEIVKAASCQLGIPFGRQASEKFGLKFYFGPNHYNTLKTYDNGLDEIIPTGWSIFSYLNKALVIPLFNWLSGMNMGIVILILTIIVKVLLLPIAYKTYMSGARMRMLKPEMDVLNAKYEKNNDPMKKQQDQMALYRKAGVSPFSGCLPMLVQIPILFALFSFVPAAIELRQKSFLWADDLSTYDSVWTYGYVPVIDTIYGDHISLFALLMFVSTIIYTYMNSNLMPQQSSAQMPGMKFMMYFMPVIFLAFMNRYAAGLSWYYFLANMFTFLQNWIMKKLISDQKIRTQLEENMKKPTKVSGFQKRLEEMAKQRQQAVRKR